MFDGNGVTNPAITIPHGMTSYRYHEVKTKNITKGREGYTSDVKNLIETLSDRGRFSILVKTMAIDLDTLRLKEDLEQK